jgi:hypothetical protein
MLIKSFENTFTSFCIFYSHYMKFNRVIDFIVLNLLQCVYYILFYTLYAYAMIGLSKLEYLFISIIVYFVNKYFG